MYHSTVYMSPIGRLILASEGSSLIGLWIEGQKYFGQTIEGKMVEKDELPIFTDVKNWLDRYFQGKNPSISELRLAPIGSEFRQTIWSILCEIPYGDTITYGELAQKAAKRLHKVKMSAQAAGGAVGHNPITIIIPCHRVVGTNGSLTGYAGGIDVKARLLEHEGVDISGMFAPKRDRANQIWDGEN